MEDRKWNEVTDTFDHTDLIQTYVLPLECQPPVYSQMPPPYRPKPPSVIELHVRHQHTRHDGGKGGRHARGCHTSKSERAIPDFFKGVIIVAFGALLLTSSLLALFIYAYTNRAPQSFTTERPASDRTINTIHSDISVSSNGAPSPPPPELVMHDGMDVITEYDYTADMRTTTITSATSEPPWSVTITNETGPMHIPLSLCLRYLPYNTTSFPNRFGLGQTASEGIAVYRSYSNRINTRCHPDADKLLCRIFFSRHYHGDASLAPPDPAPLPCRSLCEELGRKCIAEDGGFNVTWSALCRPMPQSGESAICFQDSTKSTRGTPSVCSPSPCPNNGLCMEVAGRAVCRCAGQFYGSNCQHEFLNPCATSPCLHEGICEMHRSVFGFSFFICHCSSRYHGVRCEHAVGAPPVISNSTGQLAGVSSLECHPIPPECQSALDYNTTHGFTTGTGQAYYPPWSLIESFTVCSPRIARQLFCALAYEHCATSESSSSPLPRAPLCRDVCESMKGDCEFLYDALSIQTMSCIHQPQKNSSVESCIEVELP